MSATGLAYASYISLATFRKDGRKVATPIWAAPCGVHLVMFSDPDAGKVKRLRNSPSAEVALCDVRGKLLGEWTPAQAFLIDDQASVAAAAKAMRKKYGWQSLALDTLSRIGGRLHNRQYIRIELSVPS